MGGNTYVPEPTEEEEPVTPPVEESVPAPAEEEEAG
jgi:hypothetical protein